MRNLFEAVDAQKFFTLDEAKVTDYIDADRLGEICSTNPILRTFNDCEPIEGMVLKMTGDMGVSYYKVIKNDDGDFEAYLIDQSGKQLGDAFPLEWLDLDESSSGSLEFEETEENGIIVASVAAKYGYTFSIIEDEGKYKLFIECGYDPEYDSFELEELYGEYDDINEAKTAANEAANRIATENLYYGILEVDESHPNRKPLDKEKYYTLMNAIEDIVYSIGDDQEQLEDLIKDVNNEFARASEARAKAANESENLTEDGDNELYCILATLNSGAEYMLTKLGDKQKVQKVWDKIFYDEYDNNVVYKQKLYRKIFPENLEGEEVLFELVGGSADIMKQCVKTGFGNTKEVTVYDDAQDTINRFKTDEEIEASRSEKNMIVTIKLINNFSAHFGLYMNPEDWGKTYVKEWTIAQSNDINKLAKLYYSGIPAMVKYAGIENELIGDHIKSEIIINDKDGKGPYDGKWIRSEEEAIKYFNAKYNASDSDNIFYYKGQFYESDYKAPYYDRCITCGGERDYGNMSVCSKCDEKYLEDKYEKELQWTPEKFPVLFK